MNRFREIVTTAFETLWGIILFVFVIAVAMGISTIVAKADVLVDIDKSSQRMYVFVDDVQMYEWPISTGVSRYDTPSGEYGVTGMHVQWYSKKYDYAPMPHSIFFTNNGHAIHGTTEVNNLGLAASHGCVRLHPDNAKVLFELVSHEGMGVTKVVVSGDLYVAEAPPAPPVQPRSKAEVAPLVPEQPPVIVEERTYIEPPVIIEEEIIIDPPVIVEEYVRPPRWLRRQWRRERRWLRRQERRSFRPYRW